MSEPGPDKETPKETSEDSWDPERKDFLTPRIKHDRWVTPPPEGWVDGALVNNGAADRQTRPDEAPADRVRLTQNDPVAVGAPPQEVTTSAPRRRIFSLRMLFRDIVVPLAIAFIVAMFAQATVAKPYQIPSGSMLPAIQLQDRILANRLIYRFRSVERGDVIVFTPPMGVEQGTPYVKRVVGLPGDVVEIRNGKIMVNGEELVVPTASSPSYMRPAETVPDGMLFVLGDNRNESSDSHIWGYVPVDNIIGRADVVYWPPKDIHLLGL